MNVEITQSEKDDVELKVDNPTIVELLRVYLNQQGVKFVAWRREHPSKPVIMKIQASSGTVKKAVSEAIVAIQKDIDAISTLIKKSK